MSRTKKAVAAVSIAAGVALSIHAPAPAYAAGLGYHIKNSLGSNAALNIYASGTCSGSQHILYPGQTATSLGWDSFRMYGVNTVQYTIYDDKTGNFLALRQVYGGVCVKNISDNTHYVQGN